MQSMLNWLIRTTIGALVAGLVLALSACANRVVQSPESVALPPQGVVGFERWEHWALPGKSATQYAVAQEAGRSAVAVTAASSASLLRQRLRIEPHELGRLQFSWKIPALIEAADLGRRDAEDAPVRVVLVFEGDTTRFSMQDSLLSELSRTLSGEPLPYATLMYVWCNTRAPGTVIPNSRTQRIRKLVVESGSARLNQWLDYERDIRADFEQVFGEPPGALVGIAIMTDTDNTRSSAQAWYGPLRHTRVANAADIPSLQSPAN